MASTPDIHALRVLGHHVDALAIAVLAGDSVRATIATARLRRAAYRACRAADQAGVALLGPYIDKTVQPMLTLASLMPMAPGTYACGLDAEQDESPHLVGLQGSHADLHDTSWRSLHAVDCALDGASLRGAVFDNAVLEACNLAAADLLGASWRWSKVTRCALAGARLTNAILEHARFVDCDFRGADFSVLPAAQASTWRGAFVRCDLRDSLWHARELAGVIFIDCKLSGARAEAVANGVTLADAARTAARCCGEPDGSASIHFRRARTRTTS
jgi:uncharacterized protein YjbI with pentapeptide repeats